MPLARSAIINGQKVAISKVRSEGSAVELDSFSRSALSRFGFLGIAQKIIQSESLSFADLNLLLSNASLPVLMKLVSLKSRPACVAEVHPIVVLPLGLWIDFRTGHSEILEITRSVLDQVSGEDVYVTFDNFDLNMLEGRLPQLVKSISECRAGLHLLGPQIDQVLDWLNRRYADLSYEKQYDMLRQTLLQLKACGFEKLRSSGCEQCLELTHELGLKNSLVTDISAFPNAALLSEELLRVNKLAAEQPIIDIWGPGVLQNRKYSEAERAVQDLQLLRALAVGTLCMDKIDRIQAQSRFFSLEALNLAHHLGANDLGCGAFDEPTSSELKIDPFHSVTKAVNCN